MNKYNFRFNFYRAKRLFGLGIGYQNLGTLRVNDKKRYGYNLYTIELILGVYVLALMWDKDIENDN